MQLRARHLIALIPLAAGIAASCKQSATTSTTMTTSGLAPVAEPEPTPPSRTPSAGGNGSHAVDITRLATVRCQHEERCGNVGTGKRYATSDACLGELQGQGVSEVYRRQCPGNIDVKRLDTCIAEINTAACRDNSDPINQIRSCSVSSLCPSMNTP